MTALRDQTQLTSTSKNKLMVWANSDKSFMLSSRNVQLSYERLSAPL